MNIPRIIFVDDEPRILQCFQNLFWRDRKKKWEMVFVSSGQKALEEMSQAPFDLIISDMCMPGMDGLELMKQVSQKYPGIVRMILSGYAGKDAMMEAIPVAHQYLRKPCDPAVFRMAIERAVSLHEGLNTPALRTVVGKISKLPSVPRIYLQLCQVLKDPRSRVDDIIDTVKGDPALAIRVVQLANSSSFGSGTPVGSIDEAVRILGNDFLKGLALYGNILSSAESVTRELNIDQLQASWIASANLAKSFVKDTKNAEMAFTGALIRDIGTIIIAQEMGKEFHEISVKSRESQLPVHTIEKEVLGTTHSEIGAYLLAIWGLPLSIVEAVAFHHLPKLKQQAPFDVLAAVHVAAALVDGWQANVEPVLDMEFIEACRMTDELSHWMAIADKSRNGVHHGRS